MKINIDREDELYNTFDKFDETLSEDLITYINNKAEMTLIKEKENIENRTKEIWLLIIGILFIAFSISLADKINVIVLEIISTIGSFSIWEAANSWLLESKSIKLDKLKILKLKNSEIRFKI